MLKRRPTFWLGLVSVLGSGALVGCGSEDTAAVCASEDAFEPNGSVSEATAVDLSATADAPYLTQGFLCSFDEDWFAFDVKAGQLFETQLRFIQADGDLELELVDGDGAVLDSSNSISDLEAIRYTFETDGRYFLRVFGRSPITDNSYELSAQLLGGGCGADTLEPNDIPEQASPLSVGRRDELSVCYGEIDWYQIPAVNGQVIQLDAIVEDPSELLAVSLHRQVAGGATEWLASSQPSEQGRHLSYRPYDEGPYLLRVARAGSTVNANYSLNLALEGEVCEPDVNEPNNGFFDATPIADGFTDQGLSLCVGDADWYQTSVGAGQLIHTRLDFQHEQGDLALHLYQVQDDGTLAWRLGSNGFGDQEEISYRAYDPGDFVFAVFPTRGSSSGQYDMSFELIGESCLEDQWEPNNSGYESSHLADGTYSAMTLCPGDDDWFSFEARSGQLISTEVNFSGSESDLGLALYKQNDDGTYGYRAGSNTRTSNESILYRPYEDGPFMLRVYRTRGTQLASYSLTQSVSGDACLPDAQEPNNAYPEARAILPGNFPDQTLCVGDADWFSFQAENGQLIEIDVGFEQALNDIGVAIYKRNDDGTVSYRGASNTLTDNEHIVYRPYESGEFLVYVYRTRGTAIANYSMDLAVTGQACLPDTFAGNSSSSQAALITPQAYSDQRLCAGEADWYRFSANNGQLVDIALEFTHSENDLGAALYKLNADGTLSYRQGANSLTDNEFLKYRPYDDGEFLLYVYRTRGTAIANYGLTLGLSGEVCAPDMYEPNNSNWEAVPWSMGAQTGLTLCVGDADWYEFNLSNGQMIDVNVGFEHALNDLGVAIYKKNSDGTASYRRAANSLTDNEWLQYRPFDSGTFYLSVYRTRGTQVAFYDLSTSISGAICTPDVFEPNDSYRQASSIEIGLRHPASSCVGDSDYYDLGVLPQGTVIDSTVWSAEAGHDMAVTYYTVNPDNTLVGLVTGNTIPDPQTPEVEHLVWAVNTTYADRRFFARVYRSRGTASGAYDVQVNLTPLPPLP